MRALIDSILSQLNGDPCDSASFSQLEQILAEQNYWLAYWQDVNEGINYRRFFAISDLVGMRVKIPRFRSDARADLPPDRQGRD